MNILEALPIGHLGPVERCKEKGLLHEENAD